MFIYSTYVQLLCMPGHVYKKIYLSSIKGLQPTCNSNIAMYITKFKPSVERYYF